MRAQLGAVVAAALLTGTVAASTADDAKQLIARVATRDESLHAYTARLDVRARTLGFPWSGVTARGSLRYEAPSTYRFDVTDVPFYARGLRHLDDAITKPVTWTTCQLRSAGRVVRDGREVAVIEIAPPADTSDLRTLTALVDPALDHLVQVTYVFSDGTIVVDYGYTHFAGHDVIASEHALIHRGRTNAAIDVNLSDYARS